MRSGYTAMNIISADERVREPATAKILLLGPAGVGKTSLLKTFDRDTLASTLFVDIEAGALALASLPVTTVRPKCWTDCRDLACALGGPNTDLPATSIYSTAHHDAVAQRLDVERLRTFRLIFWDSLTATSRLSFASAETAPETVTDRGRRDLRQAYGIHSRQMLDMLHQLQQARGVHVVMVAILEVVKDDFGRTDYQPQIEGAKTGRELPGIVDEVITMQWADAGDGKPFRAFYCTPPCIYPTKDRSGKLEPMEEPNLQKLLTKLTT